jgi:hypothetical protein
MTEEDLSRWIKCDQCSAQAMWLFKGVEGELYFCGHHKNKNFEALDKWSYEMIELNKVEEDVQLTEMAE